MYTGKEHFARELDHVSDDCCSKEQPKEGNEAECSESHTFDRFDEQPSTLQDLMLENVRIDARQNEPEEPGEEHHCDALSHDQGKSFSVHPCEREIIVRETARHRPKVRVKQEDETDTDQSNPKDSDHDE
jgi:hypothetical protein